ncbi:MAG: hypothetical protein JKY71_10055 [Alphaproteobacteria bacterium]|nr:hypothetical protein [Alphaproteobacteria bacterium]
MANDTVDLSKRNTLRLLAGAAAFCVVRPAQAQISDLENAEIDTYKDIRENLRLGGSALWIRGMNHEDGETNLAYEKVMYLNACDTDTLRAVQRFFTEVREDTIDNFGINAGYQFSVLSKIPHESEPVPVMSMTANSLNYVEGMVRRMNLPYRLNAVGHENRCLIAGVDEAAPTQA